MNETQKNNLKKFSKIITTILDITVENVLKNVEIELKDFLDSNYDKKSIAELKKRLKKSVNTKRILHKRK